MNTRCFKEVVEQIQQIWNNVHEATLRNRPLAKFGKGT